MLVVLLLSTNVSVVLASDNIKDVSRDHWAYKSVVKLVDKGYMSLYDGNKFKGEKEVTRYELAEIIAKMLSNINQGQVNPESGDVLTLKKLSTEFRSELVEVVNQNENLKRRLNELSDQQEVNQEDLVNTNAKINDLRKQVDKILKSITEEAIRTNKLQKKLNELETKNENLKQKVDQLSSETASKKTEEKVEKLEQRFFWLTGGWIVSALLLASQ
nr:S-layer homology domain-containing protein [Halanaerobacter jeridensis]